MIQIPLLLEHFNISLVCYYLMNCLFSYIIFFIYVVLILYICCTSHISHKYIYAVCYICTGIKGFFLINLTLVVRKEKKLKK